MVKCSLYCFADLAGMAATLLWGSTGALNSCLMCHIREKADESLIDYGLQASVYFKHALFVISTFQEPLSDTLFCYKVKQCSYMVVW